MQALLALVRSKQRELEENHEKSKTITRSDEMRALRDDMQQQMDDVQSIVKQIKDRLEALDKANAAAVKKKVCSLAHACTWPGGRVCTGAMQSFDCPHPAFEAQHAFGTGSKDHSQHTFLRALGLACTSPNQVADFRMRAPSQQPGV